MQIEEMLRAMKALGDELVIHTPPGCIAVNLRGVEITNGSILEGVVGRGGTIDTAIKDLWQKLSAPSRGKWVVRGAYTPQRSAYLWNGFMWEPYPEPKDSGR